nr:class II glutamine amidotransferase [Methanohalobium evestigatum]
MLGLSFNISIKPSISFTGFRSKGEQNPDGWGIAYYPVAYTKNKSSGKYVPNKYKSEKSAQIIKEPIKPENSKLSRFLINHQKIESKLIISHLRKSTKGKKNHTNTHPFSRELYGKEYVFAHNGTIQNKRLSSTGKFTPIGSTDSENIFCYLLNCIEEHGIAQWDFESFEWLSNKLNEINENGKLNCIFSDSEYLFCYQDNNLFNKLCYINRKPPNGTIRLSDNDLEIDLDEEKDDNQTGYVIATKKLTDENWIDFEPGELLVFKNGSLIYSNKCYIEHPNKNPISIEREILAVLRSHSHRVSLNHISQLSSGSIHEVKRAINSLLFDGYIRQDRRDRVSCNHEKATFYTNPIKRNYI